MTETNKDSLRLVGGEILKWVATSMIALCVYFANQIRDDVEESKKSITTIQRDLAVAAYERQEVKKLEQETDELERRVRALERGMK